MEMGVVSVEVGVVNVEVGVVSGNRALYYP